MLTIGSLFSGIGGFDLGLERAGVGRVVWQVELDPYCRRVLAKHWPHVDRSVTDVREAGARNLAPVDVLVGGFPCQDVSSAGAGAGLDGARSGLWYEFHRIVDEVQPCAVVVENVASGASQWLCAVRSGLHELGYRTRAIVIAASDVGAPHRRQRVFVLAVADSDGDGDGRGGERRGSLRSDVGAALGDDAHGRSGAAAVADTDREPLRDHKQRQPARRQDGLRDGGNAVPGHPDHASALGRDGAEPRLGGDAHGLPDRLDGSAARWPARWPAGRGEAQHAWEPPRAIPSVRGTNRKHRLHGLGNSIVPACAEAIGYELRRELGR